MQTDFEFTGRGKKFHGCTRRKAFQPTCSKPPTFLLLPVSARETDTFSAAMLPRLEIPLRDVTPRGDVFPCRGKERNTTWIGRGEKDKTKASSSDLGDARSRGVHSNAFALHRRLYYVCTTRVLYNFAREISVSLSAVDSTRVSSSIDSAIDSLVLYESTGGIIARQEETVSLRFFRPTIAT